MTTGGQQHNTAYVTPAVAGGNREGVDGSCMAGVRISRGDCDPIVKSDVARAWASMSERTKN